MLKIRNVGRKRRGLKNAKVVERELCSILTPGTRTLSTLEIFDPSDDNVQLNPAPLLALFRVADTAAAAAVDAELGEFLLFLFCLFFLLHLTLTFVRILRSHILTGSPSSILI